MINKKRGLALVLLICAGLSVTGCSKDRTNDELAYRKIGIRSMEQGNYKDAVDSFQRALDQSKGKIRNLELDICMNKAEALYLNEQPEDAIAVCDAVLDYDNGYANAYYLRGNIYLQQGDVEQALSNYEQAAKHADADYEIYIQLFENLNRAGRKDDGLKYLNQALELKGKGRNYLASRGYIYFLLGDYASAKDELTQAVAIEKKEGNDDKAELYLAQTYDQLGDRQEAEKYYELYAKDHADDAIVLEELGNMAMEQQDYTQALTYYQNGLATTKSPVNEQKLRRGEIAALEQMYEFEQAKEKMSQYVLDYPDDEEAAREYLFLKTRTAVADQIEEEQQAQTQGTVEIENSEGSTEESTGEDSAEGETNA